MAFIQVEALESRPLGEWERSRRLSIAWCKIYRHSATSGIFLYIDERLNKTTSLNADPDCFPFPLLPPLSCFFFHPPDQAKPSCVFVKAIVSAHHRGSQKVCHWSIGDWWVESLLHVFASYLHDHFCGTLNITNTVFSFCLSIDCFVLFLYCLIEWF